MIKKNNKNYNDNKKKILIDLIKRNKGYIVSKELKELNIHRYHLTQLEKEGRIERIKRGMYKDTSNVTEHEFIEVSKLVPNGVLCLETAIDYHNLSTNIPFEYKVAIPLKSKVVIPDYPPIKLLYFTKSNYELGIIKIRIAGFDVKIYDIEKTVCDVTRYRKKLGIDLFSEVLKEYLKRKDKNLSKLLNYAKQTKTFKILNEFIEVMI